MTHKSIVITSLTIVLMTAVWLAEAVTASESHVKCRHSRPATGSPPDVVAVTAQGALFHRPGCKYVHGPVRLESGAAATASGYTPCTRCLPSPRSTP
jgi:hypothetical protein